MRGVLAAAVGMAAGVTIALVLAAREADAPILDTFTTPPVPTTGAR